MSTAFCADCNCERPKGYNVISITPDAGWIAEFTAPLADGEAPSGGLGVFTSPDGTRWDTWRVPVIGWAVVEHHYGGEDHEQIIEPVLLSEDEYPVAMTDYRASHRLADARTRLRRGQVTAST